MMVVGGECWRGHRNFLYELDAATGRPVPGFGEGGRIDLRKDLDADPEQLTFALTTPGVIFEDKIILGGRLPETHPAAHGDIRALQFANRKA